MAAVGRGERLKVNTGLHESTCASAQLAVQVLYSEVRSRFCQGYAVTVAVTYTMPVSRYTIYVPLLIGRSIPCITDCFDTREGKLTEGLQSDLSA